MSFTERIPFHLGCLATAALVLVLSPGCSSDGSIKHRESGSSVGDDEAISEPNDHGKTDDGQEGAGETTDEQARGGTKQTEDSGGPGMASTIVCQEGDTRECDTHPEDGVGTCRAGTQTCDTSNDPNGEWSNCAGGVGPGVEECGPQEEDTNCDGVAGNGEGCLTTIYLFGGWRDLSSTTMCRHRDGWLSGSFPESYLFVEDPTYSPNEYPMTSFKVFKQPYAGVDIPVMNCSAKDPLSEFMYNNWTEIGGCSFSGERGLPLGYPRETEVLGYVASASSVGYERLRVLPVVLQYTTDRAFPLTPIGDQVPLECMPQEADYWTAP